MSEKNPNKLVQRLKKLLKKATSGPWQVYRWHEDCPQIGYISNQDCSSYQSEIAVTYNAEPGSTADANINLLALAHEMAEQIVKSAESPKVTVQLPRDITVTFHDAVAESFIIEHGLEDAESGSHIDIGVVAPAGG